MGCCGDREKGPVSEEAKWEYIALDDFKSKSCFTPFSYIWLWILIFTWIGVIVVDTFTAVQLLAFDQWSSTVKPKIQFSISKWIFAGCIIFSFVLLAYEIQRAVRVMKRGGVADSYLDPLAVEWQSARMGKGRGWKRFLVFAELTKSKKGVDYIALFVYFQFKTSIRILIAEGPRQVINAFTLYSIFELNLLPTGKNAPKDGHNGIQQFWSNLEVLANQNERQVMILASMLYTFVIWVISAILLAAAVILYTLFLWHHIPSSDGSLTKYCRRKIDGRLAGIVSKKTRKALEKAARKDRQEERQALKRGETFAKPTLPGLDIDDDTSSIISGTTAFSKPGLARTATFDTMHASSPSLMRQPTLPDMDDESVDYPRHEAHRPMASRTVTGSSYASNAPLLDNRGMMGYSEEPVPPSATDRDYFNSSPSDYRPGPPPRSFTGTTQRSSPLGSGPPSMRGTPGPYGPGGPMSRPPTRPPTAQSRGAPTPGPYSPYGPGGLRRVDTSDTMNSNFSRRPGGPGGFAPSPISPYNDPPQNRRISPPEQYGPSYEMSPVRTSPPGGTPIGAPQDPYNRPPTRQDQMTPGPPQDPYNRPPTRQGQMTPGPPQDPYNRPPTRQGQMTPGPPQVQRPPPLNRAPTAPPMSNSATGGSYVAFNPAMHAANAPPSSGTPAPQNDAQPPPQRNMSSPVQRFGSPVDQEHGFEPEQEPELEPQQQQQQQQQPQRSFTAPVARGWHGGPTGTAVNR